MAHILAVQLESNLWKNTHQLTNQLLSDLHAYYKSECEEPVERLGNLMIILEMIVVNLGYLI
jgi:hypothetical protein